ncbi:hypothetical protein V1289_006013 [Bradyrhizobium sp. AZCC 2289]
MIFSENRVPLFRIMLRPKSSGSKWLPVPQPRVGRGVERQRESLIGVAWGARPKPGPASPANVSKRGLFARHYAPNQTPIMVNARLPKGNLAAGNQGGPGGYESWNRVRDANPSHQSALSRRHTPESCKNLVPPKTEGAGKAGCALHPRSRAPFVHKNTHTSIQVQRRHPAFPAQWFYGL